MSVDFHFLNVGDGDCTVIDFPARTMGTLNKDPRVMMVDSHHHEDHDEYEHIIDYYKRNFRDEAGYVRPVFRYIATHPHKDHMKGIKQIFGEMIVQNFWDVKHEFEPAPGGPDWDLYKDDWEFYKQLREGESDQTVLRYTDASKQAQYWDQDRIEVLSPSPELYRSVHYKEDGTKRTVEEIGVRLNNLSYVLLIRVNGLKVLLTGDAEPMCWDYIMRNHKDKIRDVDILKAPHHGRESAFHEEAVKWMNPRRIVFSVAEDCEHAVPEKYEKAAPHAVSYKTHELGSFILRCGFDGNITLA